MYGSKKGLDEVGKVKVSIVLVCCGDVDTRRLENGR
jgi:hypothetical protein